MSYVWYSRTLKGQPFPKFGEAKYEGIAEDDYFLVRATYAESEQAPSFQRAMTRAELPTLSLKDFGAVIGRSGSGLTRMMRSGLCNHYPDLQLDLCDECS